MWSMWLAIMTLGQNLDLIIFDSCSLDDQSHTYLRKCDWSQHKKCSLEEGSSLRCVHYKSFFIVISLLLIHRNWWYRSSFVTDLFPCRTHFKFTFYNTLTIHTTNSHICLIGFLSCLYDSQEFISSLKIKSSPSGPQLKGLLRAAACCWVSFWIEQFRDIDL